MDTITLNSEEYVNSDYLFKAAPIYCKPHRSARELVKAKCIKDFVYMKSIDDKWTESNGKSYKLDKIFIKKTIVDLIPEVNGDKKVTDDNGIEAAPKRIELKDNEKFHDQNGAIINIETRGTRTVDGIYFRVKDVSAGFNMPNLGDTIIDPKRNGYIINEHYKYFICSKINNDRKKTIAKKELFLTYEGMLRVLFASHSQNVKPFIKWATETIFALHMGTTEQKHKVIGSALGVNADTIKEVFDTARTTLPCVYLFTLGQVKDLRSSMKIDSKHKDDDIVAKYGYTKDLSRRASEHIATYGKIKGVDLKLKYHAYMDPQYMSQGENDIRMFMDALKINLEYEKHSELVVIPKDMMKLVDKQYQQIGNSYMGHISELITKIKELENKIEKQSLTYELGMEKMKHENEILKKDTEIIKLKLQLAEHKQ